MQEVVEEFEEGWYKKEEGVRGGNLEEVLAVFGRECDRWYVEKAKIRLSIL